MTVEKKAQKTQFDFSKLTDGEVATLVVERDVSQYRVERIEQLLNDIGQAKGFSDAEKEELDFDKLIWEEKRSEKGAYWQTSDKANNNSDLWQRLKIKLHQNNGFWQNQGYKYWFDMGRDDTADRRKIA